MHNPDRPQQATPSHCLCACCLFLPAAQRCCGLSSAAATRASRSSGAIHVLLLVSRSCRLHSTQHSMRLFSNLSLVRAHERFPVGPAEHPPPNTHIRLNTVPSTLSGCVWCSPELPVVSECLLPHRLPACRRQPPLSLATDENRHSTAYHSTGRKASSTG